MNKYSDQEWVRLLKQEDKQATHDLWVLMYTYGINIARRYCAGDEMRAEDVGHEGAQKAFMRLKTRGLFQFRFGGSFQGYCRRIAANEVKRVLGRSQKPTVELPEQLRAKPSSRNAPEIRLLLQPCLDQLSSRENEVIKALYFQELTPAEAAEKLGVTRNNVDVIAYRVRKKLKRCMQGRGFANSSDVL